MFSYHFWTTALNIIVDSTIEYIFDGILAFHHVLFVCYMIT